MSKSDGLVLRNSIWHMRFMLRGVSVAETTSTGDRRKAVEMVAKRKADIIEQAMLGKLKSIKLHDAIDKYVAARKHLASHESRKFNLSLFKTIADKQLDKVTRSDTQQVIDDRYADGTKASTVSNAVTYFNAMVKYFADQDYNVCKKMEKIKGIKGRVRWLSDEEEVALFAALNPANKLKTDGSAIRAQQRNENYDLAVMLRHTGARLAEISTMHWNQVDFNKGEVHIKRGKGSNDSTIVMSRVLNEMLTRRRKADEGDLVFPTKVTLSNSNLWIRRAVTRAKINTTSGSVSLHTLRHTAAVKWLQGGLDVLEVKEMLGHKSIQSTLVYTHLIPGVAANKAAAVLDAMENKPVVLQTVVPATTALRLVG